MKIDYLKLSPGFFVLWVVLVLILASKVYLIGADAAAGLLGLALFGGAMLGVSYLGAWAVWSFSGKEQRTGEISYLALITVFFLVRTVMLYQEAIANQ